MDPYLLEMKNIHKRFPGVYALKGVNLCLRAGEIRAIVGENGAGKSTLINVLGGIHMKDEGEIIIDGKPADINSVLEAREAGISIIHQELVLVPYLSVAENIFINREPLKNGMIDYTTMYNKAQEFIDEHGLDSITANSIVLNLTMAQKQMVEIVKAVSFRAKIIVMDEPTSSLSDKEIDKLFRSVRMLKEHGIGILFISHRLSEIPLIADTLTVLRDGESVGTAKVSEITNDEIVKMMVGREITNYYTRTYNKPSKIALEVKHLSSSHVHDINFELYEGEILGFYGLIGAGRTELMKAIVGFDKVTSGEILINSKPVHISTPAQAYALKIGFIPENRREEGIIPVQTLRFNMSIKVLKNFIHGIRVNFKKECTLAEEYIDKLKIKSSSQLALIQNLSGGNQQKVVIASWLATKPIILIMDEPTRGIDVGAKTEIFMLMNKLAAEGIAIIMISSDLPEIINMSDRVCVMRQGSISKVLTRDEISQEKIMKYAVKMNI